MVEARGSSRRERRTVQPRLAGVWLLFLGLAGCRLAEREMADRTPQGCAKCHVTIAQQWQESAHAHAWTNPEFLERTGHHRVLQCLPCHASSPLLERPVGERPELRTEQRESGVDCSVCHQRGCGYAGPHRSHLGPHPTEQNTTHLPCPEFCGSCHEREHQEYAEMYVPAMPAGTAQQCVQCHMPTDRARLTQGHVLSYIHPKRETHDHSFPTWTPCVAAGAVEVGASSFNWSSPQEVSVRFHLTNQGAGHRIPSGAFGHRTLRIAVEFQDDQGQVVGQRELTLTAGASECLDPGRSVPFALDVTLAKGARPVRATLLVERVNRDHSFRYALAEATWPLAP